MAASAASANVPEKRHSDRAPGAGEHLGAGVVALLAELDARSEARARGRVERGEKPRRVPEKRHAKRVVADPAETGRAVQHVIALERAGELIGKGALALAMATPERTLRSYTLVERRLPSEVLHGAAAALERRCAEISAHAAKLREMAGAA